jgi:hypothetical protein
MSLPRPCLGCGLLVRGRSYHPRCQPPKRPTTERGYGWEHQQLRAQLVASLDPWAPCPVCSDPLGPDPHLLDLMHTDDRRGWLGLGHARCNRGAVPPKR